MKKMKWLALLLAVVFTFTGCGVFNLNDLWGDVTAQVATPFADMEYARPDIDRIRSEQEKCCAMAQTETDVNVLLDQIWVVYDQYNHFNTQYSLANIHYFRDMTDTKWEEEYSYCLQNAATVESLLDELLYALADCPLREELEKDPAFGEGYFDSYDGESLWDDNFLELMNREAKLEEQYYDLCTQAQEAEYYSDEYFETYGIQMGQLFVELVALRQEIAAYAGYDDYTEFAYDYYFYRDYTPAQAEQYLQEICRELVPLYKDVERWGGAGGNTVCTERAMFSYVEDSAEAMGGTIGNAFKLLRKAGLYDITYSEKKYDGSFELYLSEYAVPYVFVNPMGAQMDKLTFAHEFGHFCNDYASGGTVAGVDVLEIFSQGMEYLSLCYGESAKSLAELKMVDCLRLYVEQSAYALFEQQVYDLKGEELTVENVYTLYEQIGTNFGFDVWEWDSRDFVLVAHFFTEPMYIVSYVVSNDAAFQLYQMEKEESGTGLALMDSQLATQQPYFLAFLEEAGLESPFAQGRLASVKKTLTEILG